MPKLKTVVYLLLRLRAEIRCWWRGYHMEELQTTGDEMNPWYIATGRCLFCAAKRGSREIGNLRPGAVVPLSWNYGEDSNHAKG